jgi:putative heme-binding domain-containing protein
VIVTDDGRSVTGLLVKETPEEVSIFDGKETKTIPVSEIEERGKLRQSSMPEGLAATLSANEFLDVVTYLKQLKSGR